MEIRKEARLFRDQLGNCYNIGKCYKLFANAQPKMEWSKYIWNRWSLPKHNFILWLAFQNRLATRERVNMINQISVRSINQFASQESKVLKSK